jgi:hypothetical protein
MSEYTDITLINCNRSASVEARSNNNSNPAVFINTLQQTLRLDVGDKVSVDRAFISEVGAGNPSTIEFKGNVKGKNKVGHYTHIQKTDFYYKKLTGFNPNYRLGNYRTILTTEKTNEEVDLKDNLAPMIIGYYITSNEYPNYIQQPRRFTHGDYTRGEAATNSKIFTRNDEEADGLCRYTINPKLYVTEDWVKRNISSGSQYKQRVDNTRFTLFIKDEIRYSTSVVTENTQVLQMYPQDSVNGIFSEGRYVRVRERIDLRVNQGFNTASATANQLTQQLTQTKKPINFKILDSSGFEKTITKITESTTYKPIDAQNLYNFNNGTYTSFMSGVVSSTAQVSQNNLDYISTFGYIGIKRPEIYEAGKILMETQVIQALAIISNGVQLTDWLQGDYFKGLQVVREITNFDPPQRLVDAEDPIVLNVKYTKENCEKFLKLFDTQKLYPELWDSLKDSVDYNPDDVDLSPDGAEYPDKDNSRFLHINVYTSDTGESPHQSQLGEDHFKIEFGSENVNKCSSAVFFVYDDTTRNDFVEGNDYDIINKPLMMGFARPRGILEGGAGQPQTLKYYIEIDTRHRGGLAESLFTETGQFENTTAIKNRRRIGFDLHSSAFSTAIITPYSGYSDRDIGVDVSILNSSGDPAIQEESSTHNVMRNVDNANTGIDITPYQTMTYIGANNPAFDYNTISNRFEIRRFHTANNVGDRLMAGCQLTAINSKTRVPTPQNRVIAPPTSADANSVVYKINPRPPQFGFSPTFKPYTRYNQGYRTGVYPETPEQVFGSATNKGLNTNNFEAGNDNVEPFSIFDSHGGIYIDNWGYDEENWEDNLWDILGFDYSAVNASVSELNTLKNRVNNDNNLSLYRPTTNAEIVSTDSKVLMGNLFGGNMYYTSLPYPQNVVDYESYLSYTDNTKDPAVKHYAFRPLGAIGTPLTFFPEITIKTESTSIVATDIQKSVLKPYYEIRSSIIEGYSTIGGNPTGSHLPLVCVVDKYSANRDYFLGNPSGLEFTITKPTMISDITTSIHDSDGEYSNVDLRSAIIYKITKIKRTPTDIIQQILNPDKKNEKKQKL